MGVYGIHNALVLQKLGMSLDRKMRPLELQEISLIGQQMLSAVEELHMSSMLHRWTGPAMVVLLLTLLSQGHQAKQHPDWKLFSDGGSKILSH
jgi:hypothetical protein